VVSEITLSGNPNQTFSAIIPGDKRNLSLNFTQSFNEQAGYWVLGIYDSANVPIVTEIPLLPGYNILGQYEYLSIGELYVVNYGDQAVEKPDETNIGTNFKLVWVLI